MRGPGTARGTATALTLIVLLMVAGCGGASTRGDAVPPPPADATRAVTYAVGTATMVVTDPNGVTPARGVAPEHRGRTLPTTLWFPRAGTPAPTDLAGATPLAGRFPLVAFAHGFAVTPQYYRLLLHDIAAHGYVVAAPLFPISGAGLPGAPREDDMFRQPGDLSAVITELTRPAVPPRGPWTGVVDPRLVAIAGHSDGAEGVAAMVLYPGNRDARVSAAVVLAGRAFPPPVPTGAAIPTLVEQGLADRTSPAARGRGLFGQLSEPKAYLTEARGSHTSAVIGSAPADADVRACIVDFLDVTLRRSPAALADLERRGSVPGHTGLEVAGTLLPR